MCNATKCIAAIHGHPESSISVPIESANVNI